MKSHKKIYFTWNVTIKNLGYVKIKSVNPLDFTFDKINGFIEKSNGNKYMMLVSTDKSKEKLKKVWRIMEQNQRVNLVNS